jgi:FKBP-type peptidyl-prolyl cis-trans isomerase
MIEKEQEQTLQRGGTRGRRRTFGWTLIAWVGCGALAVVGLCLSFSGPVRRAETDNRAAVKRAPSGVFSSGREVGAAHSEVTTPAGASSANDQGSAANSALSQRLAQEAAAQQQKLQDASRRQEEQLAARQRELDQRAAEQEETAKKVADEAARVQEEKDRLAAAKLEAEKTAEWAAAAPRPRLVYSGPTSGVLVWQGEVRGTALVTINGSQPDQGQIVSGALPGVLVLLQPADAKHVVIASSPSPSNGFQRLTLRVQGNGVIQQSIHWSIP